MKPIKTPILTAPQIRAWDAYTIENLPISSLDLMEQASIAFVGKFKSLYPQAQRVGIVCGLGNNGGDGLAVARLLHEDGYQVQVLIVRHSEKESADFQANLQRLPVEPFWVQNEVGKDEILPKSEVLIDALFGSGLNKPLAGVAGEAVQWINAQQKPVVSIDIASGLFADSPTAGELIVRPTHTISFEVAKLAFLLPENAPYVGEWHTVPIGLDERFLENIPISAQLLTTDTVGKWLQPRPKFSHKGTFGHALLIGGSYGKMGAVVLATKACLRSGAGLLTAYVPEAGYNILQTTVPEAMCLTDENAHFITQLPDCKPFTAISIGVGLGKHPYTKAVLWELLRQKPTNLVVDADALNILSEHKELLEDLPTNAILTPHPKEFERLTRPTSDNFERLEVLRHFAIVYRVFVILKGAHSVLATPAGELFFNTTGNAGMATGGSGDVLTGIITGFLAQGYAPLQASALGMFVHGLSGDVGIEAQAPHALTAGDLVQNIGKALKRLS